MDTLIKNAILATSYDVFQADVAINEGKITQIEENINPDTTTKVIDAKGMTLLPGGVDVHTHLDLDVGFTRTSDNWTTGTIAAACGGTTTIVDHMAFGPSGCKLTHQPEVYHKLAEPAVIDYGFHGIIQHVNDEVIEDMKTLRDKEGIQSFKIYLTYSDKLEDNEMLRVMQRAKELGLVICAHCENNGAVTLLTTEAIEKGHTQTKYYPTTRPPESEAEAVYRFAQMARMAGDMHAYVVHLSTRKGLDAIRLSRAEGQKNLIAETCPQYLFLDDSAYTDPVEGLKYMICPPLRKRSDQDALWQGIENEEIATLATDHCDFFFETQKQRGKDNFALAPNGGPSIELRMAMMFSEGYKKGRLTLPHLVQLCCTRPAQIFGLAPQKGDIVVGADADFVLFNEDVEWTVHHTDLHENCDYTPYENMPLTGRPVWTMSRGEIIAENNEFVGKIGRGKYMHRKLIDA